MGRFLQPPGQRGSQRWIQALVNDHPGILADAIGLGPITWRSPRADDEHAEYRDQAFLDQLGISLPRRSLADFWPAQGPQWDALGRAASGEAILVEAKAHLNEVFSTPSQAGPESMARIRTSLQEAASSLGATAGTDWALRFYQYGNRLAHAYLLQTLNDIPTRLVFVYFVGDADMHGPATRREWETAISVLHEALGIRGRVPGYVKDVFIDIRSTVPSVV